MNFEKQKNKWLEIIQSVGFSPENHDIILNYIKTHSTHELQYPDLFLKSELAETTLPYAFKVFKDVEDAGLLNKIHFVNKPNGGGLIIDGKKCTYNVTSHLIKLHFHNDGFSGDIMLDMVSKEIVDSTSNSLIKILTEKNLVVYMLFSGIKYKAGDFDIMHRYQII